MGAKSSVDDLGTCLGSVSIRAATTLRYVELKPLTGRFVISDDRIPVFFFFFKVRVPVFWKFFPGAELR